jgi:hypothetical protein
MSKQRDDINAKLKRLLEESWDEFCSRCGEELYRGDPPVYRICRNPDCPDCDPVVLEEEEDYEYY